MHPLARVLAIAYVALAVLGAVVYAATTANYLAVTDVEVRMQQNAAVSGTVVNWTGNTSQAAKVAVSIAVTNPGTIAIRILNLAFNLHMADPNTSDPHPWYDAGRLAATFVGSASFNVGLRDAPTLSPGETHTFVLIVTVDPRTTRMDVFNRPDASGRFHPIAWAPTLVYTFADFAIQDIVYIPPYYDVSGVLPNG